MISNLAISPIQKRRYGHTFCFQTHHSKETDMSKTRNYGIAAAALLALSGTAVAEPRPDGATRNIVIVHGAFVDGSGWRAVHDILESDGYHVIEEAAQSTTAHRGENVNGLPRFALLFDWEVLNPASKSTSRGEGAGRVALPRVPSPHQCEVPAGPTAPRDRPCTGRNDLPAGWLCVRSAFGLFLMSTSGHPHSEATVRFRAAMVLIGHSAQGGSGRDRNGRYGMSNRV